MRATTRLGRDVAIKILPNSLTHDQDRLRRFEQEARAVAALNHPNLADCLWTWALPPGAPAPPAANGLRLIPPFIVSELLEGTSLRERLAAGAPCESAGPWSMPSRLRRAWQQRTSAASSIAI